MAALSELHRDVYKGVKKEFRQSPWTVASVILMWSIAWMVYLFIYPELARISDVRPIQADVRIMAMKNLDREILSILTQRCRVQSKIFLTSRLHDLIGEYENMTGKSYPQPLPSCEELN